METDSIISEEILGGRPRLKTAAPPVAKLRGQQANIGELAGILAVGNGRLESRLTTKKGIWVGSTLRKTPVELTTRPLSNSSVSSLPRTSLRLETSSKGVQQ